MHVLVQMKRGKHVDVFSMALVQLLGSLRKNRKNVTIYLSEQVLEIGG